MRRAVALLGMIFAAPAHAEESTSAASDAGEAKDDGRLIDGVELGLRFGVGGRLDDPPVFEATERSGLLVGGVASLRFAGGVAVGLAYEHRRLGAEAVEPGDFGTLSLERDLDSAWLELGLDAVRGSAGAVFMRLGLGAVLQSLAASGVAWPERQPALGAAFRCDGGGSLGLGLRAEAGGEAVLSGGLRAGAALGLDGYQLGDESIDGCAPGAGSAMVLGVRAGLAYTIPL